MPTLLQFDELAQLRAPLAVSLFMPTHRSGPEVRQDPIRFRNLLVSVERLAAEQGRDKRAVAALLAPARALVDDALWWQHQGHGLAYYLAPDLPGGALAHRLPLQVDELVTVSERPCVRPLLPAVTPDLAFDLLALSQKRVRLLHCSPDGAREVDLHDIPESLQDVVGYDWEQRALQFHAGAPRSSVGGHTVIFHGHGQGRETDKEELERFVRRVDDGVLRLVADRNTPLVVAAAEPVLAAYHRLSRHPALVAGWLEGNPDRDDAATLHARALPLVRPLLGEARRKAVQRVREAAHSELVVAGVADVLAAVRAGRVATLLVRDGPPLWGRGEDGVDVAVHGERQPHDDDLLDLAVVQARAQGADVHVVGAGELPGGAEAAALLRF